MLLVVIRVENHVVVDGRADRVYLASHHERE